MIVLKVWHDNSDIIWLWCRLSIPDSGVGVGVEEGRGSNLDTQLARRSLVLTPSLWPGPGIIRWLDLRGLTTAGGDNNIIELREGDLVLGIRPGNEELRLEREKESSAISATIASNPLRIISGLLMAQVKFSFTFHSTED